MNILITGITSFIARALARELMAEGYEVYGAVRADSKRKDLIPDRVHVVECGEDMARSIKEAGLPGMVALVHFAWEGAGLKGRQREDVQVTNRKLVRDLIPVAAGLGCSRFLFAGSQAEYGITLERVKAGICPAGPVNEFTPCDPISPYGKAKHSVLGEALSLCREHDLLYIHMRIYSAYGKGDHETTLVSQCIKTMSEGGHISLSPCEQMWNFIHVTDCAKAIADLVNCVFVLTDEDEPEEHVVNIAGEETKPLKEFAREIREVIGKGSYDHDREWNAAEGVPYLSPDIGKLKALTGFVPQVAFKEGILRTI